MGRRYDRHVRALSPALKRLMQKLRGEDPSSAAMRESLEEVIEESERKEVSSSPRRNG